MKGKIAWAAALAVLAAAPAPASAGSKDVFATWDECMAVGSAADRFWQFNFQCRATADGYELVWHRTPKTK